MIIHQIKGNRNKAILMQTRDLVVVEKCTIEYMGFQKKTDNCRIRTCAGKAQKISNLSP